MIRDVAGGATLEVRVLPRAKSTALAGERDGALAVRVSAPPVEGAANDALLAWLAERLRVPRRAVSIEAGLTGRRKRILVLGISAAEARARLGLPPT